MGKLRETPNDPSRRLVAALMRTTAPSAGTSGSGRSMTAAGSPAVVRATALMRPSSGYEPRIACVRGLMRDWASEYGRATTAGATVIWSGWTDVVRSRRHGGGARRTLDRYDRSECAA